MPSTIRDLTELTTPATDDYFLVSDTSDVTNRDKRISQNNLLGFAPSDIGRLSVAQTNTALKTFSAGVSFGQSTLNWYEDGNWTPVTADAAPTGGNVGGGTFTGRFVRIGSMVTVWANLLNLTIVGMTTTNVLYIRGLPYPARTLTGFFTTGAVSTSRFTFTQYVGLRLASGVSHLYLVGHASSSSVSETPLLVSDVASAGFTDAYFTLSYLV